MSPHGRAVSEGQRAGEIVGHARGLEFGQHGKVHRRIRIAEAAADRLALALNHGTRAAQILFVLEKLEIAVGNLDRLAGAPDEAPADGIGMQRAHEDTYSRQGQTGFGQALAEFGENGFRGGG